MFIGALTDLLILIGVVGVIGVIVSRIDINKKDKILIVVTSILLILLGAFSTGVIMCILFHIIKFLLNLIMSVL